MTTTGRSKGGRQRWNRLWQGETMTSSAPTPRRMEVRGRRPGQLRHRAWPGASGRRRDRRRGIARNKPSLRPRRTPGRLRRRPSRRPMVAQRGVVLRWSEVCGENFGSGRDHPLPLMNLRDRLYNGRRKKGKKKKVALLLERRRRRSFCAGRKADSGRTRRGGARRNLVLGYPI